MPKTNDATGATYLGHEGIVEHAGGRGSTRPGGLSEVHPNRELDGAVVEGFESEEQELSDREGPAYAEPQLQPQTQEEPAQEKEEAPSEEEKPAEKEEVPSSLGSSSARSTSASAKTSRSASK